MADPKSVNRANRVQKILNKRKKSRLVGNPRPDGSTIRELTEIGVPLDDSCAVEESTVCDQSIDIWKVMKHLIPRLMLTQTLDHDPKR